MVRLLIWLVGSVVFGRELWVHNLMRPGLSAAAFFGWVLWVCGGASLLSAGRPAQGLVPRRWSSPRQSVGAQVRPGTTAPTATEKEP